MDRELDVAAGQRLFRDGVSLPAGFDFGSLHGVCLEELRKPGGGAPPPLVVVVLQLSAAQIADDGVVPARQFDGQAGSRGREQLVLSTNWRGQAETFAGRGDRGGIANFGPDGNDVRNG